MAASLESQAAALMSLAQSAMAEAGSMANRIVRTDPNFSVSFSHTVTAPTLEKPTSTDGLVSSLATFNYAPNLPVVTAPSDPSTLIGADLGFSHDVAVSLIGKPTDTATLLGTDLRFNHQVTKPTVDKPTALPNLLPGDGHEQLLAWMDGEVEQWFNRFFPELSAASAHKDKAEQWLFGIITGSEPFGVDPAVFDAVWNQARDREYRARNSAVDQLRTEFSARGFSLPPGAMVSAIRRAEESAADAIAGVNLAQMIRESEIKVDLLKFAEDQALRLKSGVMQSLADFYRQWAALPNDELERARLKVGAYDSLNRALGDFYQVESRYEELRMKAAELRATGGIEESKLRVSAYSAMNDALMDFRAGEISVEELRIKAENLRSSGALEESRLKVSTYTALQNAMSEYRRIVRDNEALKGEMARLGVDAGIEVSRMKVAAYSAMHSALAAHNSGQISIEELKLQAKKIAADVELDELRSEATVRAATYGSWNSGYSNASRAMADIAGQVASAAGTLNAQVTSL